MLREIVIKACGFASLKPRSNGTSVIVGKYK